MTFRIHICYAVGQEMNLESGFEQIFTGIADAIFRSYAADIYIRGVKKFENLSEGLVCMVYSFEAGILFHSLVTALVEGEFLSCIRQEVFMDFASTCACDAMRRPYSSLCAE